MRTANNGDFLDIFMNHITHSSRPWVDLKKIEPTIRQITSIFVKTESALQTKTFLTEQLSTYCYLVKDATASTNQKFFNPLGKYPKWNDAEYRQAYLVASIEQGVAWQIKTNRKNRGLSQEQLAEMIGTQQSAISRLEDPEYGSHSIETLIQIANAFDCALSVKFIPFSLLAIESADLGQKALFAESYANETTPILEK